MKNTWVILVILSCLIIAAHFYGLNFGKAGMFPGHDIIFEKSLGGGLNLFGLVAKKGGGSGPSDQIAIYQGKRHLYSFSPLVPAEVDYPRPLRLEGAKIVQKGKGSFIMTTWGETGADYFGTHPILIRYSGNEFKASDFYKGDLSADPRISGISWTRKDFLVKNYFNSAETAKTILTQGVAVRSGGEVELRFYGDDLPRAAEHRFVKILLPLMP